MLNSTSWTSSQIASICDHTFLKTVEAYASVKREGDDPIQQRRRAFYDFLKKSCESPFQPYGICVRAEDVPHAKRYLQSQEKSNLVLSATVGFPDGSWYTSQHKLLETQYALSEGADEIDMPMNWKALKQGDHGAVLEEILNVRALTHRRGCLLKLILETSLLDDRQIIEACRLAKHAGVDFIKTSTGFGPFGAQIRTLRLMLENFDGGVKISGGINLLNVRVFLQLVAEVRRDVKEVLDPKKLRIGESTLLSQLLDKNSGC